MITLRCRSCERVRQVDPALCIGGIPVERWFGMQNERCTECHEKLNSPGAKLRRGASDTSRAAAEKIYPKAGTKRAIVLDALTVATNGLTDEEMQVNIPMKPNTQRPRRVELLEMGFIRDSGQRRLTTGGDSAIVWETM